MKSFHYKYQVMKEISHHLDIGSTEELNAERKE